MCNSISFDGKLPFVEKAPNTACQPNSDASVISVSSLSVNSVTLAEMRMKAEYHQYMSSFSAEDMTFSKFQCSNFV